jgi:hypothetical protein
MIINFYGVHGIENIKTVKKNELILKGINNNFPLPLTDHEHIDIMTKVLDKIHDNNDNNVIYKSMILPPPEYKVTKDHIDYFLEYKCNWRDQQYRISDYYVTGIHGTDITGPMFYVLVVLKEVVYMEGDARFFKVLSMVEQLDLDNPSTFGPKELSLEDKEVKDAIIVVSRPHANAN